MQALPAFQRQWTELHQAHELEATELRLGALASCLRVELEPPGRMPALPGRLDAALGSGEPAELAAKPGLLSTTILGGDTWPHGRKVESDFLMQHATPAMAKSFTAVAVGMANRLIELRGCIPKLLEKVADAALRRPSAVQARHEPRSGPVRPLDAGGVVAARQPSTNIFGMHRN